MSRPKSSPVRGESRPLSPGLYKLCQATETSNMRSRRLEVGSNSAMTFPDRLKLPLAFDPARMRAEVAALAREEWIEHFVPGNYEGDWSVIPLRAMANARHPVMMIYSAPGRLDFADTRFLAACPYIQSVLNAFECPLQAARLMRLGPGSTIKEHRDHDLDHASGVARIHVPVVTSDEIEFHLNQKRVVLEAGSAWYLRLSDPHSVVNKGTSDRVHLVIDTLVNPWLDALFAAAMTAEAA